MSCLSSHRRGGWLGQTLLVSRFLSYFVSCAPDLFFVKTQHQQSAGDQSQASQAGWMTQIRSWIWTLSRWRSRLGSLHWRGYLDRNAPKYTIITSFLCSQQSDVTGFPFVSSRQWFIVPAVLSRNVSVIKSLNAVWVILMKLGTVETTANIHLQLPSQCYSAKPPLYG